MDKRLILIGFVLLIFLSHSSVSYSQEEGTANAEIMRILVKISGDIEGLKAEIKRLDGRIDELSRKVEGTNKRIEEVNTSLRGEFENLRTNVREDLENFRTEVRGDLDELRWFVGTFLSVFAIIIGGVLVAILSYVFKLAHEIRPGEVASEPEPTTASRLEKLEASLETLRLALEKKGILEPGTTSSKRSQS